MFENIISIGSIIAVTLSVTLTIKFLKINIKNNIRENSHDINGNNNIVNIIEADKRNNSDFKLLANVIGFVLLIFLPLYPYFFLSFMQAFSWLPIFIILVGVATQVYFRGWSRLPDLLYVFPAFIVGTLTYHSIYLVDKGKYLEGDIYSRLIDAIISFNISESYALYITGLLFEFFAYAGFIMLFLSAIYISFSFLKKRGFDETIKHLLFWLATGLLGDFLASGCMLNFGSINFNYLIYSYQLLFYFLQNPF
ncbi:hypothetical protein ACMSZT_000852 [Cronobacter dublinensis]